MRPFCIKVCSEAHFKFDFGQVGVLMRATTKDSDAPRYVGAFIHNIVMSAVSVVFMIILRIYLGRLNKKLDAAEGFEGLAERSGVPVMAVKKGFRYLL